MLSVVFHTPPLVFPQFKRPIYLRNAHWSECSRDDDPASLAIKSCQHNKRTFPNVHIPVSYLLASPFGAHGGSNQMYVFITTTAGLFGNLYKNNNVNN
jgi:hypothetical protein